MLQTDNFSAADTRICKDRMKVTVTNIHPVFQKKSEQEARQETAACLYQIFKKYADV